MGFAKRELQRYEDEKWSYIDDKKVCRVCLETGSDFVNFYKKNAIKDECEYCYKERKVIEINDLLEFIAETIHSEYQIADSPSYDHEDGYYAAVGYETDELMDMHIEFNNEKVRKDIISAFDPFALWSEQDPYATRKSKGLHLSWMRFSEIIKYERRYFFPRPKKENLSKIHANGPRYAGDILNIIFQISKELKIITTLEQGTKIYRARPLLKSMINNLSVKDIGVPPVDISAKRANRLNAVGIPIFYGAFTSKHLQKEVRLQENENLLVGEFHINKDVHVLDLTKIPVPSIFRVKDKNRREAIKFLNQFKREIMKPVLSEGIENLEYIPSQIFAEFIRHRCQYAGQRILGIKYPSAFTKTDINLALFISNDLISESLEMKPKSGTILKLLKIISK